MHMGTSYKTGLFLMARTSVAAVAHHFTALLPFHTAGLGNIHAVVLIAQ